MQRSVVIASLFPVLPFLITVPVGCAFETDADPGAALGLADEADALETPVPSMAGLPGFYLRVPSLGARPGEVVTMWVAGATNPDRTSVSGSYSRTVAPRHVVETGSFHAIPNNPAIGWAAISFVRSDGEFADAYVVEGILRDLAGRISTLQLRRFEPDNQLGPPFLMQRVL
jgi:hypothetical protein